MTDKNLHKGFVQGHPGLDLMKSMDIEQEDLVDDEYPILVIIGSLSNASKQDTVTYAASLAASQCLAEPLVKIGVWHDKSKDRWVYEIHEGGRGYSYIEPFINNDTNSIANLKIKLAGERICEVEEIDGELISLISRSSHGVLINKTGGLLKQVTPDGRVYLNNSMQVFKACAAFFILALSVQAAIGLGIKTGLILPEIKAQLDSKQTAIPKGLLVELYSSKERLEKERYTNPGAYISKISYSQGRWQSEISK